MKSLGYVLLIFVVVGVWIVWQIARRASAGAQAIISPERYAIQKVEKMQRDVLANDFVLKSPNDPADERFAKRRDKWDALVKFDPEISAAAEQLRPYGNVWIDRLGQAYFALEENRAYLPNIVDRLRHEAQEDARAQTEREEAHRWAVFSQLATGEPCTDASLSVLRQAEGRGYVISIDDRKVISASKLGIGTSYFYSNSDIEQFGRYL
jgi:hypothetical protein